MKKILLAVVAMIMTVGMMAQCPKEKPGCPKQGAEGCGAKRECVYSAETRAMMRVDRIAQVVKDLTAAERKSLVDFYRAHFAKCEQMKAAGTPIAKEECCKACDAELRRVLGDERYIQYLEGMRAKRLDCEVRRAPRGEMRECPRGEKPVGCCKR